MVAAVGYPYTDALAVLQDHVQSSVAPTLSAAELDRLLRYGATDDESGNEPDNWPARAVATVYALNYRVVPASRNGYLYKVTTAGTSHVSSTPTYPTTIGDTVTDGTVVWTCEATAAWTPTYSQGGLNYAAMRGWEMKFAKLTAGETFGADGASFNPETRRADIEKQINMFRRRVSGSFRLTGRTSRLEHWDDLNSLSVNG
jgi:hypothetical protein